MLAGCGGGPSQPGRFYVLSSPPDLTPVVSSSTADETLAIGVGPIELPPHLDRTQIVTQTSRHRLDLKDLDQWAEPLKDGFKRVLAQNLSRLLGTNRTVSYPWRRPLTVQLQVTVEVLRFDTDSAGESVLAARWNIVKGDGRKLLYSRTSTFRTRVPAPGIEPIVAAMSGNVAELSREIATGIMALRK
jgi:uncharacterized lipoprotein YmbA